jgi:flagellar motor component MotA
MTKGSDTLNTVTGIVALSYLVVIPVAGYLGYKMLQEIKLDVDELWTHFEGEPPPERQGYIRKYLLK